MTLNQSALLELTEVLRTADEGQLMRSPCYTRCCRRWSMPRPPRTSAPGCMSRMKPGRPSATGRGPSPQMARGRACVRVLVLRWQGFRRLVTLLVLCLPAGAAQAVLRVRAARPWRA